tara:strand:- start:39806 stop:41206 length:1401 start_codon:yes stop_codon:yes gene_type:complete
MSAFKAKEKNKSLYYEDLYGDKYKFEIATKKITGSRLYGTQYEKGENPFDPEYVSDYDYRGVFILPPELHLSPYHSVLDTAKIIDGDDEEFFELKKFFTMAKDNNPNIMDVLFANEDYTLYENNIGKEIRENKDLFLSQKIKDTFSGFAESQLQRIKGHKKMMGDYPDVYVVQSFLVEALQNKDIDYNFVKDCFSGKVAEVVIKDAGVERHNLPANLPVELLEEKYDLKNKMQKPLKNYMKPKMYEFMSYMTSDFKRIKNSEKVKELNNYLQKHGSFQMLRGSNILRINYEGKGIFHKNTGTLIKQQSPEEKTFLASAVIDDTNYKKACKNIDKLWEWKVNRNEKRAILERKFGYDTKHGMHLLRLLTSCKTILETGDYNPRLSGSDLDSVMAVREGHLSYDKLLEEAARLRRVNEDIVASGKSNLQKRPDDKKINKLMLSLFEEAGFKADLLNDNVLKKSKKNTI